MKEVASDFHQRVKMTGSQPQHSSSSDMQKVHRITAQSLRAFLRSWYMVGSQNYSKLCQNIVLCCNSLITEL